MILLCAACRKTSVSRTTGTAPDEIMSASTWPGPTEGSQAALELRQTAQDGEHQPAVRRGGIGPAVMQALERRALVADLMQDVEQIAGRARQPIARRAMAHRS